MIIILFKLLITFAIFGVLTLIFGVLLEDYLNETKFSYVIPVAYLLFVFGMMFSMLALTWLI